MIKSFSFAICLCSFIAIAFAQQNTTSASADMQNDNYLIYNIIDNEQTPFEFYVLGGNTDDVQLQMKVFPNPVTYNLKLVINQEELIAYSYKLYAPTGQLLTRRKISSDESIIDMHSFQEGNYLLQVFKDQVELKTFKIVKK